MVYPLDETYELEPWVSRMPAKAPHIGHRQHLCDLCARGECTLEQVKELVREPNFICKQCGRVANKEENLCQPTPL